MKNEMFLETLGGFRPLLLDFRVVTVANFTVNGRLVIPAVEGSGQYKRALREFDLHFPPPERRCIARKFRAREEAERLFDTTWRGKKWQCIKSGLLNAACAQPALALATNQLNFE